MTDPQQQRPSFPPYGTPGSAPAQPAAPLYQAPPGAFAGPAGGYAIAAPAMPERPGLGRFALALSLFATVVLSGVAVVLAAQIAEGAGASIDTATLESGSLSFLTPVRDLVLWLEITGWAATAIGIWALIQGIVATVRRRGRGTGIAAIVVSAIGPFVFFFLVWIGVFIGGATAAASRYA
ncbi:hypothetical protein [uncultured Microbacterium sp.]|uniref:hypothetical protein n=1 Tax=uncultured Microbacterium sp. TaxID=191216 RepID=UPI0025E6624B|nr:hypothetical protein [uncultured Microbacterium sp.]